MERRMYRGRPGRSQIRPTLNRIDKEELRRCKDRTAMLKRRLNILLQTMHTPLQDELQNPTYIQPSFTPPTRLDILLSKTRASYECQKKHSWNPEDCSPHISIRDDELTFYKRQNWSTDCIRGKVGFTEGLHIWKVRWSRFQRWKEPMIGVATQEAPLRIVGSNSLIGNNDQYWTWNIGDSRLYHNPNKNGAIKYPFFIRSFETFSIPDKFLVVLDMDNGNLSFIADGQYLGIAFEGLRGRKLYPYASATWDSCEVTMKYLGGLEPEALSLQDMCRNVIRYRVGPHQLEKHIAQLELPDTLQKYLLYKAR